MKFWHTSSTIKKILLVLLFVCVTFFICKLVGVVTWTAWYPDYHFFYDQANALMHGHFAISSDPGDISIDLAWHHGVQQIWGLTIPILLIPFELFALLFLGNPFFPERIFFLVSLAGLGIYGFLVLQKFLSQWKEKIPRWLLLGISFSLSMIVIFSPPFISLLLSRFQVWEEIIAYECIALFYLLFLTIHQYLEPSGKKYILICILAGILPSIRPTGLFYIVPTIIIAWVCYQPRKITKQKIIGLLLLFACGFLLLITNYFRFGAPLEFGHAIHASRYDVITYTTVFTNPFKAATGKQALQDFIGSFFYTPVRDWKNFYQPKIFPLQPPVVRIHEFYFRVYDYSYAIVVALAWILGIVLAIRWYTKKSASWVNRLVIYLEAWSIVSVLSLTAFYLWTPSITSRYFVDFTPGIFAGILGLFLFGIVQFFEQRKNIRKIVYGLCIIGIVSWLTIQYVLVSLPSSHITTKEKKVLHFEAYTDLFLKHAAPYYIPTEYVRGQNINRTGIAFNGLGWTYQNGSTSPLVLFYVENPRQVTLTFDATQPVADSAYRVIFAKIGLEYLHKISDETEGNLRKITFQAPTRQEYRTSIQLLYIGFQAPEDVNKKLMPLFRLLKVTWN